MHHHRPSFFKVITSDVLQHGILGIPKTFITKHGKHLPDTVFLTVPSGLVWHVELRKADGAVSFENGFLEFLQHYSVCVGHFLVFRYDAKSEFHLLIFDMTGTEVDYLQNSNSLGKHKSVLVDEKKDEEKHGVIKSKRLFKSRFPFFKVSIAPGYLGHKYLPIPKAFAKRYLVDLDKVILEASTKRKSWHATLIGYPNRPQRMCTVTSFLADNKIKVGDICFFELTNQKKGLLKFHVVSKD